MGRTIVADESVENYIVKIQEQRQKRMGLIIGQVTKSRDLVLALAVTPDDEADGKNVVGKAAREPGHEHGRNKDLDMTHIDTHWLATHAQQVNRMLVGGVDVIGVFVAAEPNAIASSQDQLRQCLYAVYKRLGRAIRWPTSSEFSNERVLLMINTGTNRVTCRTFDIADHKSSATPAEWKYQALRDRWVTLNSQLTVEIDVSFNKTKESVLLNKKIESSLVPFCHRISQARATVNGHMSVQPDDVPITSLSKARELDVDLFVDHSASTNELRKPSEEECCSKLSVYGRLCGRAYVHSKATVSEAVKAIKTDLMRSLLARCELLCEDLEITEGQSTYMQFYKPPSRVFAQPLSLPVCFCDYIFADEEPVEVVERLSELLDVTVPLSCLDLGCERSPDDIDIPETTSSESFTVTSGHSIIGKRPSEAAGSLSKDTLSDRRFSSSDTDFSQNSSRYIIMSAVIVAVLSVLVIYLLYLKAS